MTPERWREVTQIYGAVVSQAPERRAAAVAELCGADEELRREVNSLLHSKNGASLLERAAEERGSVMQMLTIGSQIGVFRIDSLLGVGGMGEVYRARDTKLNRDVAIKILPTAFANDPDRLARFKREAQVLASLNHPNIATIHGFEDSSGVHALVLELVDGDTLADRLGPPKGRPLPIPEALAIARQIADALEAAHEQGIVHRDLKPANIKVRDDGTVKVLDFGLAKIAEVDGTGRAGGFNTQSPTITTPAMTAAGMILGTAAYMSPEQAKGRPADARSDIWAFGCVLFEMLTGQRAFDGEDVSDTLANVLKTEPTWDALPAATPSSVRRLLTRCLDKDRRRRLAAIADARFELEAPASSPSPEVRDPSTVGSHSQRRIAAYAAAVAIAAAAITSGIWWQRSPADHSPMVTRFTMSLAENTVLTGVVAPVIALSPSGDRVVYAANNLLFIRNIDEFEARPIPGIGVVGPGLAFVNPVFSPDGQWLAFFRGGSTASGTPSNSIQRISLSGGAPAPICNVESFGSMSWTGDEILISTLTGIFRAPAGGGKPELLIKAAENEVFGRAQRLSEDALLINVAKVDQSAGGRVRVGDDLTIDDWDRGRVIIQSLKTGQRTTLIEPGSDARYLSSGHLLYMQRGAVFAVPFDLSRRTVMGAPVAVIEGVMRSVGAPSTGTTHLAVSESGSIAYVAGPLTVSGRSQQLAWIDRAGMAEPLKLPLAAFATPRLSPDQKRLVYAIDDGRTANIWIYDLSGANAPRQLTLDGRNRTPVWSQNGQFIAFQSDREKDLSIFRQRADGTTVAERLTKAKPGESQVPESWSPDGKTLLFSSTTQNITQLWSVSIGDHQVRQFGDVQSHTITAASFSPDGQWVTYTSREEGQDNTRIYIQRFPDGPRYLATAYGFRSQWSSDGKELFFARRGESFVMSVSMTPEFNVGNPIQLPIRRVPPPGVAEREYDVTRDGQRFIFALPPAGPQGSVAINVVLNWFEELKKRVPLQAK